MSRRILDPALTRHGSLTRRDFVFAPEDGLGLPVPAHGRAEYFEASSGLRLRVTASGARTWAVAFWSPTTKAARRMKVGDPRSLSLAKARARARAILASVDEGQDPYQDQRKAKDEEIKAKEQRREERERRRAERAARSVTFGELCERYTAWRATTPSGLYKRTARPNTVSTWRSILKLHVQPVVGAMPPADIETGDFIHVMERAVAKGGPSQGPRVREFLSAVWRWLEKRAKSLGVRMPPSSPLLDLPRDIGAANEGRTRVLTPAELWRLWRATEDEGLGGFALRFMLLTAARVREATLLPWTEVNLEAKTWELAADRNKGGVARAIPLSKAAVAILNKTGTRNVIDHVFGAPSGISSTVERVREKMGGEHWQARDLRRTAATLCARLGADPFVVALVLGHARPDARMPAVTENYLRWTYEDKVQVALERLGEWVEATVTSETEPGAVVAFEAHR